MELTFYFTGENMNSFVETTLHNKIKNYTGTEHERLRNLMISLKLFENLKSYKNFTLAQYYFHNEIEKLYILHNINEIVPGIKCHQRLDSIKRDMEDLIIFPGKNESDSIISSNKYETLGWLYVSEGSTLGAAILLNGAKNGYGLSELFGARNLAEYPEGRLLYWGNFVEKLNKLDISNEEEQFIIDGAFSAFKYFGVMLENLDELY
ncbi:hypothetical protein F971_03146 [Acinetobacter vivianii]|uniref:Heme oxygenase n=1 Tax=Acinetobacter vivianii TaxID=1776742 RepID=N8W5H3_9GAMM|nr:biliverdin-producing heme oxygenase [Acinetobacter vivianii]ENU92053.1 hypothetical protein F971_03146 [Acinetobacter vivianii]